MSRPLPRILSLAAACAALLPALTAGDDRATSRRMVLVELYTSQGCDMCPTAEEILGRIAEKDPGVVPVAFHVDYFNKPWKDVFSDPLYSRRQMTYNEIYDKPKPESYGLYYTPMLMIDGQASVNGRDQSAAVAAIRAARSRPPAVTLDVDLDVAADGLSGKAKVRATPRSPRIGKSPMLLCAVLREDGVKTAIPSGENAGKTLVARFPARRTEYEVVTPKDDSTIMQEFKFTLDPLWNRDALRLAVFAQDHRSGAIHQAVDVPWRTASPGADRPSPTPAK